MVAEQAAEIPAACYVLDFVQNNPTLDEFEEAYYRFYDILRRKNPDVPVIMTAALPYAAERWSTEFTDTQTKRRRIAWDAYNKGMANGDKKLFMLDWSREIDAEGGDIQVDGGHPNDYGFFRMKEALKPLLVRALGL